MSWELPQRLGEGGAGDAGGGRGRRFRQKQNNAVLASGVGLRLNTVVCYPVCCLLGDFRGPLLRVSRMDIMFTHSQSVGCEAARGVVHAYVLRTTESTRENNWQTVASSQQWAGCLGQCWFKLIVTPRRVLWPRSRRTR